MADITIIDYGMGNLKSVAHAFSSCGYTSLVTQDKKKIKEAKGLILPGVGAFGRASQNLRQLELFDTIKEKINEGTPFLGICLGLQLLFAESEETEGAKGLSIFPGKVVKFRGDFKIPLIGWNRLKIVQSNPLLRGVAEGTFFYFVHSYYASLKDNNHVLGTSFYGVDFPAMVGKGNCYALQFHPEKSSFEGLKIINNFGKLVKDCCK